MADKKALITGSAGLIGSEAVRFFAERGFRVIGVDNDLRGYFFGPQASTAWNREKLKELLGTRYAHYEIDIRDEKQIEALFREHRFDVIIHTAAQPSHDWASREPLTDFTINADGTLILLENFRKFSPKAVFIFTSTNKVYGDRPNSLPLIELESRFELPNDHEYFQGIDESMSIDNSKHSLFGVSKLAADVMVQEYGKYFGLKTGIFRGGCLTGPAHSAASLHGFLSYLVRCISKEEEYTVFGYKGKQVRDNIHSYDLVKMFWEFYKQPRCGEVYNAGGSRHSNISVLEAVAKIEAILGRKARLKITDVPRKGDHIWYISDISKFRRHYPEWDFSYTIDTLLEELCQKIKFDYSDFLMITPIKKR